VVFSLYFPLITPEGGKGREGGKKKGKRPRIFFGLPFHREAAPVPPQGKGGGGGGGKRTGKGRGKERKMEEVEQAGKERRSCLAPSILAPLTISHRGEKKKKKKKKRGKGRKKSKSF